MGNKALRKELVALLKQYNLKLYSGNKKVAWKFLNASHLRHCIDFLKYKPGDLFFSEEYGFNFVVNNIRVYRCNFRFGPGHFVVVFGVKAKSTGSLFKYSLHYWVSPPKSRKEIEGRLLSRVLPLKDYTILQRVLKLGLKICKEDGTLYPNKESWLADLAPEQRQLFLWDIELMGA